MGFIPKCNMCGLIEPEAVFTSNPIQLQLPNYKGDLYNFYVNIQLEKDSDSQHMIQMLEEIKGKKLDKAMNNMMQGKTGQMLMQEIYSHLEEPEPMLCDRCKKKLSSFLVENGSPYEMKEF
jgi:hypothetical protein